MKRIICLSMLFLGSLSSSLSVAGARDVSYLENGIKSLSREDYEGAIFYLDKAHREEPENETITNRLATAYNNYGLKLFEAGRIEEALENIRYALALEPENDTFNKNISDILYAVAMDSYKKRDYKEALRKLDEALKYNAHNFNALLLKGDVEYYTQNMDEAEGLWQRASELKPDSALVKKRLAKLEKEISVEAGFKHLESINFDIRFDRGTEGYDAYDIKDYLREAYRDIGRDLGYYPDHSIVVIIYSAKSGQAALSNLPSWSEGIFDGKIRLPAVEGDIDKNKLKGILWHEYAHAVVYDLTLGNCPAWLNEGIAVYEESKYIRPNMDALEEAYAEGRLIGIRNLEASFSKIKDKETASLAYLQSYTMVEYFVDRYGFWYLSRLLDMLKGKRAIDESMKRTVLITLEEFEGEWLKFLKERYV